MSLKSRLEKLEARLGLRDKVPDVVSVIAPQTEEEALRARYGDGPIPDNLMIIQVVYVTPPPVSSKTGDFCQIWRADGVCPCYPEQGSWEKAYRAQNGRG